jgi:hypothetical protein
MKTLGPLSGLILSFLAAAPAGLGATPDSAPTTAAAQGSFLACRTVTDATARLACYDRAAESPAVGPGGSAPPLPTSPAPAADSTELFGLPPDEVRRRAEVQLGLPTPNLIAARITVLSRLATGKVEVELDNGQRWQQIDTTTSALKPGDAVQIRRGALGSYLLQPASGGSAIRVRRLPTRGSD